MSVRLLKKFTTEELKNELAERVNEKYLANRKERKPYYTYKEAVVVKVRRNDYGLAMNRYEFFFKEDYGYHRQHYSGYVLGTDYGFNFTNMPKVGDTVVIRKRDYFNPDNDKYGEWKICDIKKRADRKSVV